MFWGRLLAPTARTFTRRARLFTQLNRAVGVGGVHTKHFKPVIHAALGDGGLLAFVFGGMGGLLLLAGAFVLGQEVGRQIIIGCGGGVLFLAARRGFCRLRVVGA